MKEKQSLFEKMTQKKISQLVLELSPPAIIGVFVASSLNLIDSYFAAPMGNGAVAAVGVIFSLIAVIQAVGYLIGMGGGSLLSKTLGEQDSRQSGQIVVAVGCLTIVFGGLFMLLGWLFINPLLSIMGTTEESYEYAVTYVHYITNSSGIMLAAFVLGNLLRAMGKPGYAMVGTLAGVLVDIGLNIIFVVLWEKGMAGIGLAAFLSQLVTLLVLAWYFWRERQQICWSFFRKSRKKGRRLVAACILVMKMGVPSLFRQGTGSVAIAVMNHVAGAISTELQSAMSVSAKVVLLLFSVAIGCSQAMQPIVGFNYGAGNQKRVKQAFWNTVCFGTVGMTLFALVSYIWAPWLLQWFTNQKEVLHLAVKIFRYQCVVLPTVMFANAANMLFQALNRPVPASLIAAFRQGIFFLPLLFLLPSYWGEQGIYLAQPIADIGTFIACIPFVMIVFSSRSQFSLVRSPDGPEHKS